MHIEKFASAVYAICIALSTLAGSVPALSDDQPSTIAQDNEQKARIHYVDGEAAGRSGDLLTAVVELEAALTLKPSSAVSAKSLVAAAAKLDADGREAYAHYVNAADLERQGKLDEAAEEVTLAQSYKPNGAVSSCLAARAAEIADLKKMAAKPAEKTKPDATTTSVTTAATKSSDKTAAKAATTRSASTLTRSKQATSAHKATKRPIHPSVPRAPRPAVRTVRVPHPKLVYQHSYTINGVRVPGHYKFKTLR